MTIQTPETMRQLAYAMSVAEKLVEMLSNCDDENFNPAAYELASGLTRRIGKAYNVLNAENKAINRAASEFPSFSDGQVIDWN